MKGSEIRQRLKPWILPIAMVAGLLFHEYISYVSFLAPYLIFAMLFITFCKINPHEFKITRFSGYLLSVQILGALALYLALRPVSADIAQGVFICIFCPTATAAPVITGMLGGSVARLVAYSLASNITVALLAPILFAWMGTDHIDILSAAATISARVVPLIVAPLIAALAARKITPRFHHEVASRQALSFYIWAVSLFIVVGRSVSFIMDEPPSKIPEIIVIALCAGIACGLQFIIGRRIGARWGDKISGAQGLGQKNTVLAIWMALTYLNPISSVGPAAYVAWQNTINSLQLYYKQKRDTGHIHKKSAANET